MRRSLLVVVLVGCSSSSAAPAPTCKMPGTWALHYNRDSQNPGSCRNEPDAFDEVVTIEQPEPSTVTLEFGGSGGGCIGDVDACGVTNKCDHSSGGLMNGTRQDSWRFTDRGTMGGSSFFTVTVSGGTCSYNAVVSGTRK